VSFHAQATLLPWERAPSTHWIGGGELALELVWMQSQREKSLPLPAIKPWSSSL